MVNSPPYLGSAIQAQDKERAGMITARTRSKDVLPAFWRPIMVMSISVALDGQKERQHLLHVEVASDYASCVLALQMMRFYQAWCNSDRLGGYSTVERWTQGTYQNKRNNQS